MAIVKHDRHVLKEGNRLDNIRYETNGRIVNKIPPCDNQASVIRRVDMT